MSEFVGKKMSSIVHFVASLNAEKTQKICDDPPYINLKDGVEFPFGTFFFSGG